MDIPLFSILMTAYNRQDFISDSINSVINSTYQNWELIIVDDHSFDNTFLIAQFFANKDSRIKLYINDKNLGDYPNRNKAAGYAQGDYIMYVDSDDLLFCNTIENILSIISPLVDFNFGMYWPHTKDTFVMESKQALREHFFGRQFLYMGPGGTIVRRSFFEQINKYPEKYGPANDMYFNLKACCYSKILLIPFEFNFYRRHDGQESNDINSYVYNNYLYMRDALVELPLPFSGLEISWLKNKNKRRFIVQLFNYYRNSFDFNKTRFAYKMAFFSVKDIFQGCFH
jgi:glycosyltransferase involved in cell wall biosynthesis